MNVFDCYIYEKMDRTTGNTSDHLANERTFLAWIRTASASSGKLAMFWDSHARTRWLRLSRMAVRNVLNAFLRTPKLCCESRGKLKKPPNLSSRPVTDQSLKLVWNLNQTRVQTLTLMNSAWSQGLFCILVCVRIQVLSHASTS